MAQADQPPSLGDVASGQILDRVREALRSATLGEFEVYEELGRGGMARVYLAYDIALDRHVAIKVMAPGLMLEEGMAERFRREARIAASLSHPNIVPVYSVRHTDELAFFVMKYVDGCTLEFLITEHAPLPGDLARQILLQLCEALVYAHQRGVVHRDIKPANVLIDPDGRAILMDFGIARAAGLTGLTTSGASVGTPFYMSPEQWSGQQVTGQSDQYSLGVVAFQMLTGQRPFTGLGAAEVMQSHLLEPPPSLLTVRPDCPPDLARVVERMLAKKATDRWPSLERAMAEIRWKEPDLEERSRTQLIALARTAPPGVELPRPPTSPAPSSRAGAPRRPTKAQTRFPVFLRTKGGLAGAIVIGLAAVGLALTQLVTNDNSAGPTSPGLATDPPSRPPAQESTPGAPAKPVPPPAADQRSRTSTPSEGRVRTPAERSTGSERPSQPRGSPLVVEPPPDSQGAPAAPPQLAWAHLGTRHRAAVLYINGAPQLPVSPPLRWWPIPIGRVTLSLQAETCTPWDTTLRVVARDSIPIGFRFPTCQQPY